MESFVTGNTIRQLREQRGLTQSTLADRIGVSSKAVSKWETGKGLPDISLLEPLAQALGISVAELFAGRQIINRNTSANMKKNIFYVCPICGNIIRASGAMYASCCGVELPPLEAEEPDEAHALQVEIIDDERYVHVEHDMNKAHYLSFLCYVTSDEVHFRKLYPEQSAEARFPLRGHGILYAYCSHHGLFRQPI